MRLSTLVYLGSCLSTTACTTRSVEQKPLASAPASASPASASSSSAGAPLAAAATKPTLWVEAGALADAQLLGNGHVLVTTRSRILDWDVAAMHAVVRVAARPIGARSGLELVDAAGVPKLLEGRWHSVGDPNEHTLAVAADASRFLFVGSQRGVGADGTLAGCEACVYALVDGSRVHCTKVPPLVVQAYVGSAHLSPSGLFFVYDQNFSDTQVRDAATGRLVLSFKSSFQANAMGNQHWLFVGERRLITASADAKTLRAMDLPSTAVVASVSYAAAGYRYEDGHVPAPDHARIATPLQGPAGNAVGIWEIAANKSATYAIPASICVRDACKLVWSSATQLDVTSDASASAARIDVASGQLTTVAKEPSSAAYAQEANGWRLAWTGALLRVRDAQGSTYTLGSKDEP